jgi:hypothetical protein
MSDLIPYNKNSYVAFDGLSIRDLIISRLNQGQVFTDQNYQGSNLSAFIDIISYTFNTLLYYLNKTSSESMFSETQIYENMNRIVKLLNYKPIGRLGQNVPFNLSVTSDLPAGNYIIPRYSYINVGGTQFSTNQDIAFSKLTNNAATISDIDNKYLLYQGIFQEYPLYNAIGLDNEVLYLSLGNTYIDHFNIFVYVKRQNSSTWEQWENVSDLFLYTSTDAVYTTRFNENLNYEIQFGNGINGSKLTEGDTIAVYYLAIDPNANTLGANVLNNSKFINFNSIQFSNIIKDVSSANNTYLNTTQLNYLTIGNSYPSNQYSDYETVDAIRANAPNAFRSQYRLVTTADYESYIKSNYFNIISDTVVVNNDDFLKGHMKYLYDIGLNYPQLENQILFNQIKFASSCNFNNIYIYAVPNNELQDYLSPPQKELIKDGLGETKTITSNIVVQDPVYMYLDFYVTSPITSTPTIDDLNYSKLQIIKDNGTYRSDYAIISDVVNVVKSYFNNKTSKLGQTINLYQMNTDIISIDGVYGIKTYRTDTNTYLDGISILLWNGLYPHQDAQAYTQNVKLDYFQYPVFNNIENLFNKIEVVSQSTFVRTN